MWRVFVLMLGGLFGPLSSVGAGLDKPTTRPTGDYVKQTVTVEVRGMLEDDHRDILRSNGAYHMINVDGKAYYLVFGGNKTIIGKAKDLMYQKVLVTGTLEIKGSTNYVHVTKLEGSPDVIGCFTPGYK